MNATADSGKQDTTKATDAKGNTAVPETPHDKVAMLSLRADGTPDQSNPEIVGDPETAKAAAREQFKQQAVSAADQIHATSVPMMTVATDDKGGTEERPASEAPQDPSIQERKDEHEKVAEAAEKAADAMVDALAKDTKAKGKS